MEAVVNLALVFFAYSFLGWCIEVTLKYIQYHRFINRGFFTGPWLPIYGSGATLITLAMSALSGVDASYGTTFAVSFFLCGTVEYLTSWFMEKRFHARWWDYSQKPMNLHGRVWIGNLVLFGLGGVLIVKGINPVLYGLIGGITLRVRECVAGLLLAVFAADYVATHFVMKLVKTGVETSQADSTEQISREIRMLLSDRSIFYRRFADAYPEVVYRTERIARRMEAIKAESERLRREAEQRLDAVNQKLEQGREKLEQGREQLAATLEPSGSIRNTILQRQDELIGLLYDETTATDDMKRLKRDIDREKDRLRARPGRGFGR